VDTEVNLERLRSELDELHDRRNQLNQLIERKKVLMLKALPSVHGFESMDALIGTLAQFASKDLRDRIGSIQQSPHRNSGKGRRYTAELRVAVRSALEAGESLSKIARAKGISAATIIRWKKLWGIDSKRGRVRKAAGSPTVDRPIAQGPSIEVIAGPTQANGSHEEWAL
jgi:DNA invertase Pin-like site-specific DNA recombinase